MSGDASASSSSLSSPPSPLLPPPPPPPPPPRPQALKEPALSPMGMRRTLTQHVVSRWYRAPELAMCQPYSGGVDVWSVGCVFFECLLCLLGPLPGGGQATGDSGGGGGRHRHRPRPLFQGRSSYPLSPSRPGATWDASNDQLHAIFRIIGTPDEDAVASALIAVDVLTGAASRKQQPRPQPEQAGHRRGQQWEQQRQQQQQQQQQQQRQRRRRTMRAASNGRPLVTAVPGSRSGRGRSWRSSVAAAAASRRVLRALSPALADPRRLLPSKGAGVPPRR